MRACNQKTGCNAGSQCSGVALDRQGTGADGKRFSFSPRPGISEMPFHGPLRRPCSCLQLWPAPLTPRTACPSLWSHSLEHHTHFLASLPRKTPRKHTFACGSAFRENGLRLTSKSEADALKISQLESVSFPPGRVGFFQLKLETYCKCCKSPTCEQVPSREHVRKSKLFVSPTKLA